MKASGRQRIRHSQARFACALGLILISCLWNTGCALLSASPEKVKQTYTTQQSELFQICPKGTERVQVESALKEAGIEGEFGANQSIYYCDAWNREDGEVWEMNVALLFDEEGKLYSTMPAGTRVVTVQE